MWAFSGINQLKLNDMDYLIKYKGKVIGVITGLKEGESEKAGKLGRKILEDHLRGFKPTGDLGAPLKGAFIFKFQSFLNI